jgi:flavin reductase (DIM6/NTAB) family NADH-FMN oxidoreductase RutF
METFHPDEMSGRESYHMMTSVVVPRPIALVTTESRDGVLNCAPFSFFQGVCGKPPILSLSIARKRESLKDTFRNILLQSEFVVHVPTVDHMEDVETASGEFPPEVSEVEEVGFETVESDLVAVDGLEEMPVRMECRLHDQQPLAGGNVTVVFGEVVRFHIREDLSIEGDRLDYDALDPLARMGWDQYAADFSVSSVEGPDGADRSR